MRTAWGAMATTLAEAPPVQASRLAALFYSIALAEGAPTDEPARRGGLSQAGQDEALQLRDDADRCSGLHTSTRSIHALACLLRRSVCASGTCMRLCLLMVCVPAVDGEGP